MPAFSKTQQVKTTKKKKKPANERKKLIAKLDDLIRAILKFDPPVCVCCKKTFDDDQLTVGHFITRKVYSLRWSFPNLARQCYGCNLYHNYDPSRYAAYVVEKHGLEVLKELAFGKQRVQKVTTPMMRDLVDQLTAELAVRNSLSKYDRAYKELSKI